MSAALVRIALELGEAILWHLNLERRVTTDRRNEHVLLQVVAEVVCVYPHTCTHSEVIVIAPKRDPPSVAALLGLALVCLTSSNKCKTRGVQKGTTVIVQNSASVDRTSWYS